MPKRKLSKEKDVDRIQRKIQKLERKLNKRLNSVSSGISPEMEEVLPLDYGADTPALIPSDWIIETPEKSIDNDPTDIPTSLSAVQPDPIIISSPHRGTSASNHSGVIEETMAQETEGLDNEVLEILGEDPCEEQKYGPEIRSELANRINHFVTEGVSKELRKDLITKYPIPSNCTQIDAPKLNLEIKAAVTESALKRDKGIETKQKQMASAIACLSDVINTYIVSKSKDNEVLQKLMDINRMLCDLQHADSVTRRNFIMFILKSDMSKHLKNTKIDTCLFGEDLPETLRSAKAVNKSGAELKPDQPKQIAPRPNIPAGQRSLSLNRRAPAQARRLPGPAPPRRAPLVTRTRQNAPRFRAPPHQPAPAHSSRPSHQYQGQPAPPPRRRY